MVRTSTQVVGFLREADRVSGVRVRDSRGRQRPAEVRGHVVINATGVWTDEIQALSGQRGRFRVRASKGVHIVVPRDRIVSEAAIILRTEKSVLFVIPWGNHWIIGTTDTDWNLDLAHPAATKADIDYILDHVNQVLVTPLTHDDIEGVYAGLRPLLAGESDETSKLSREHAVARVAPGLVAIAGGKYTTYRVMAEDAVDTRGRGHPGAGRTRRSPRRCRCSGRTGTSRWSTRRCDSAADHGLHPYRIKHLLDRYGSLIHEVLALAAGRPGTAAADHRCARLPAGRGGVRGCGRGCAAPRGRAGPAHPDLDRVRAPRRELRRAGRTAGRAGARLGRRPTVDREVETYLARVEAEVRSQAQPDDASADALRAAAPEAREQILEPVPIGK